ncbi:DUF4870 domain-containing protein [Pseudolysinimonas sp.]|uniref:DUF4870 domain-containing protein n=1 Tax=Pseudolysinimonas sp. TaxID=2680009 RepID=UPI003783A13F
MSAPGPYSQPAPPLSPADEKTWSVLVHIGGIFFGWVAPLVGYLLLKDRGPFVRHHAVAALNFQLTLAIAQVVGVVTSVVGVGLVILVAAWALSVVFGILAARATNEGAYYRYPFAIDFVR